MDAEKMLENAIQDGLRDGIKSKLTGYNSELDKIVNAAISTHGVKFRKLLESSIETCMNEDAFQKSIQDGVRANLARTLIQRFGGEIEKQVNALKSDPLTRARITLAIEKIVASKET